MTPTRIRVRAAITGSGREIVEDAVIEGSDGTITGVAGAGLSVGADPESASHDFSGCYALPGLIDTHVHLCLPGDGSLGHVFMGARSDLDLLLVAERNAERHLAAGVTTLRDTGSRGQVAIALREAIAAGMAAARASWPAGRPSPSRAVTAITWAARPTARTASSKPASKAFQRGADFLKVMASSGGTPGTQGLLLALQPRRVGGRRRRGPSPGPAHHRPRDFDVGHRILRERRL